MRNYSFFKTPEELQGMRGGSSLYTDIKRILISWEIDEEVYRKLLPPGLEPVAPIACAFVASFGNAGFHLSKYTEGGLFLYAQHKGVFGVYCLAMPIQDGEMGVLLGRECYGYPKKFAQLELTHSGDSIHASVTRNGITFFEVDGVIGEGHDTEWSKLVPEENLGKFLPDQVYLLDYKLNCDGSDPAMACFKFDDIGLYRQTNLQKIVKETPMKVDVTIRPSEDDPWIELAPKRILSARWQFTENEMLGRELVKKYEGQEAEEILPYCFARWDTNVLGKDHDFYF